MTEHQFVISDDHPCLAGHFPGNPVVPGVVILDNVQSLLRNTTAGLKLTAVSGVKFLAPLLPGQSCEVRFENTASKWLFTVTHNGNLLAKGKLLTAESGSPE